MEQIYDEMLLLMSNIPSRKFTQIDETNLFFDKENKPSYFRATNITDLVKTLKYILIKYGKGIYVRIMNNEIESFIPFKNPEYSGFWQVHYEGGFKKGFIEYPGIGLLDNFVIKNYNNDSDIMWIRDMINILCKNRNISDCEFFINSERKLPMITVNRAVADFNAQVRNCVDFIMPSVQHTILSFNTSDYFKDFAIPNSSDFQRITNNAFGVEDFKSMKWEDKTLEFLFRGTSLSPGVFTDTHPVNQRLALVERLNNKNSELFNVGITEFMVNVPIVSNGNVYYVKKDQSLLPKKQLSLFSKSKFIFIIDEVGVPEELSTVLFSGSCILRVDSEWKCWYDDYLNPEEHYINVKSDLSDLEEKIQWCLDNDLKCKNIGLNARAFAVKYLSTNSTLDYLQMIFNTKINPINRDDVPMSVVQAELQKKDLEKYFSDMNFKKFKSMDFSHLYGDETKSGDLRLNYASNKALSMVIHNARNTHLKIPNNLYTVKYYHDFISGVNDAFIGIKCINKLCEEIPNFSYTYFSETFNGTLNVLKEKIFNAKPLDEFLEHNPNKFHEVMLQIFMALQLALERCCFQHCNLNPSNILIQSLKTPKKITYNLSDKQWAIDTSFIAIITDYSNAKVLNNFSNGYNKMFIGRYDEYDKMTLNDINKNSIEELMSGVTISDTNNSDEITVEDDTVLPKKKKQNVEELYHVVGDKDIKYLLKKMGRKVFKKIVTDSEPSGDMPMKTMKDIITKKDIKENKIRFGAVPYDDKPMTSIEAMKINKDNPRLIYDKITGEPNPHENVYDRVFQNKLPEEKTSIGNIILQYEILQTLKSTYADLNFKFTVDLISTEKLRSCFEFVKSHYDSLIETTSDAEFEISEDDNLWAIKMIIQQYISPILSNKHSKKIMGKLLKIMSVSFKDSILNGINNTLEYYSNK